MNIVRGWRSLICGVAALAIVPGLAQYEAVILNTPGFFGSWGYAASGGRQFGTSFSEGTVYRTATIWDGAASSFTTLNPVGWLTAEVNGAQGHTQVGYGSPPGGGSHAVLWRGSADSLVDLHPAGNYEYSQALGVWGDQQVGVAYEPNIGPTHAILWRGSAASFIDLTPTASGAAGLRGVWNGVQVGDISIPGAPPHGHAAYWRGTAESVVDIHPGGPYADSDAMGIAAGQVVGIGYIPNSSIRHALLWTNLASPPVNLHQDALVWSEVLATNGIQQVGRVRRSTADYGGRAAAWSGTAGSYLDLHGFLPQQFRESQATSIDEFGNIVGIASTLQGSRAVLWRPVPEPPTLPLLAGLLALLWGKLSMRRNR